MAVAAKAVNTSIGTMVVKPPRVFDNGQGGDSKDDGSPIFALAMAANLQDTNATVNLGTNGSYDSVPQLKAGGALNVTAANVNTLVSSAVVAEKETNPISTALNVAHTKGEAVINDYVGIEGGQIQMNALNTLNKLTVTTDGSQGAELAGVVWTVNLPQVKYGLDKLSDLLSGVKSGSVVKDAAGANVKLGDEGKSWDEYFNFGLSLGLVQAENKAATNIASGAAITATGGDLNIGAKVTIGDAQVSTKNLLNVAKRDSGAGVSAAIGIESMDNSAEVNLADVGSSDKYALRAAGKLQLSADVDNSYQRVKKLVGAVEEAWESFLAHWSPSEDEAEALAKVQGIENIIADLLTLSSKNSADKFVTDKQYALKSKAAIDLLTHLTGTAELKTALENLLNASSYANMYVSASTDKMVKTNPDVTLMATGAFGMQNINNKAKVNIGAHRKLEAGADIALHASVTEQNALLAGKWQLIPDVFTTDAGQNGLGGTVGVQNAVNNSEVIVNDGVTITAGAGDIVLTTKNNIINTALVMGGAMTSGIGVTGMVNYVGGESGAQTLVDDDVVLSAAKKLQLAADNDTVLTAITGDFNYSNATAVGVGTSVMDYNVKTLAQLRNLEEVDTAGKGSITANAVDIAAHTDGVLNSFALAGSVSKSVNQNKDAGGVEASTSAGKAKDSVEKADVQADNKKKAGSKKADESVIKVGAAGSVAWNYVKDETSASLDNVDIALTRPAGNDKTTGVSIAAEDSSYIGAYSGAAALSKVGLAGKDATKFQSSLSGAVAVNDVYKTTTSSLNNTKLTNADNVVSMAQNSGAQAAAGLAMGVELGKRAGGVDINLGGSGSANYVDSVVQSAMTNNEMSGGAMNVGNVAYDKDVQVGGGINFEFARGNAAAGAAISINDVDNKITAVMSGNTLGAEDAEAGIVTNLALSNLVQVGTAVSVGALVGDKAYFIGDVAVAVNMVDNDVQATAADNKIYAQSLANEARDGKLQVDEKQNKYLAVINSVNDNGIDVEEDTGKFYTLDANGNKQYIVSEGANYVYEDDGSIANLYAADNKLRYDEATGKLTDSHGRTIIFNTQRKFVDEKTKADVDVAAAAAATILDLDASAALAQANGSGGVDFGTDANDDGSLTYTSKELTVDNTGNVIVGSAVGAALRFGGGSSGATAVAATNVNDISNSFKADVADSTMVVSGNDGVKIAAASDTLMVAVAAGVAGSLTSGKVSVDAAGSGVDNTLHNDTLASVTNSNIQTGSLAVQGITKSDLIAVAGQMSGALGLTWAQSTLDNTTGAAMRGVQLSGVGDKQTELSVLAENESGIVTVGAGVDAVIMNYAAAAGAYAGSYGRNDTLAVVEADGAKANTIENAKLINIRADDNSTMDTAAGSLEIAVGESAAVTAGGAVANSQLGRNVQAQLSDAVLTMAEVAQVNVLANDKAQTLNLALGGGVAVSSSLVGVSAQGSVSVVNDDGATAARMQNVQLSSDKSDTDVTVQADSDTKLVSSADVLAAGGGLDGGVALGAAVAVNVLQRDTLASLQDSSLAADAVQVKAAAKRDLQSVATGVAAAAGEYGAAAVNASVLVNDFDGTSKAWVENSKGSLHNLQVNADNNIKSKSYNNGFSLSGAIISASVGAGVTVVDDKSQTLAGLVGSDFTRTGKHDGTDKVEVSAKSTLDVETEISSNNVALSLGAALGTGVEVVNMEAQTAALLQGSTLGSADQRFDAARVAADTKLTNKFTNVVDSVSSLAGVAVGIGVANINTQTTSTVDNSQAYAENIKVTADEERNAEALLVGAAAGGIAVGVNLMYTNLGGQLQDAYTYEVWNEKTQSYDTYTKAADGVDKQYVTDVQGMADSAMGNANIALGGLEENTVTDFTLNKGSAAGRVGVKINNSVLDATKALEVLAQGTNNVNNDIRQAAVAGAAVSVAGNRTDFRDEQSVQIADSVLKGEKLSINSVTDGTLKHYMGQGGFTFEAYSDTVSYINHHGVNKMQISGSLITATGKDALVINAANKVQQENTGLAINIDGVSTGRLVLEGRDSMTVGVELGKDATVQNKFAAAAVDVIAENAAQVKNEIEAGVTVGIISAHGSSAESRVSGAADLYVGAANSFSSDAVTLQAKTGRDEAYTTEALNHAVSVAGVDVTINRALTENAQRSNVYVGAANFADAGKLANLNIRALNHNSTHAYVHSVSVGVAGSGNNFAKVEENSAAGIVIDGGETGITANKLDVLAENVQNVTAKADGSANGLLEISPYTAKVTHDAQAQTNVELQGKITAVASLSAQALRKENTNLKADALTATLAGGGDASAENKSSNNTVIELAEADVSSSGDIFLQADNDINLNKGADFRDMIWGQGYAGVLNINTAGVENTVSADAEVLVNNSNVLSEGGQIALAAYSKQDLLVNAYVYASGIIEGTETRVTNKLTNKNNVALNNSRLKTSKAYEDITLSAADDIKLFTYALTETPYGVLGGSNAVMENVLNRMNTLNLSGASQVYSMNDVNYFAGKHLDGSLGRLDLDAEARNFNGNVIPIVLNPSLKNTVTQENTFSMADGTSASVRNTNIYADAGEELVRTYVSRDTNYGGDGEGGYVTSESGQKHYEKKENNYVDINGKVAAGMDNKIDIVIGAGGDIAIFDEAERNALEKKDVLDKDGLWERITVSGAGLTDETAAAIKDGMKAGSVDYAQSLVKRYNEVKVLMSEYASDGENSAVYQGYKAEADRLLKEMESLGEVSYVDGKYTLNAKQMVDFIEVPELAAAGGNIVIDTGVLKSSGKNGSLEANGSPEISVVNNTNLMLKLNEITIDDGGGRLIYNNHQLAGESTTDFNKSIDELNKNSFGNENFASVKSETGIGGNISIKGNYNGAGLDYTVVENGTSTSGLYFPKADILVSGNIYNKNGKIDIVSRSNNITIAGETVHDSVTILGADVALTAGGSITQTFSDGIVNIGYDVQDVYKPEYDRLVSGKKDINDIYNKENGTPYDGEEASGSYISGGVISLNATDINVNGIIQSGYGDYVLSINNKNSAAVEAKIKDIESKYTGGELKDDFVKSSDAYEIVKGGAYWDYDAGCYVYRLSAYYNPSTKQILVQDVNASGGQIYLTGRISSTGGGQIISLDGVSNIKVESNIQHDLVVGSLLTNDVQGLVSITDTAGYVVKQNGSDIPVTRVTEYTNGSMQTYYVDAKGNKYNPNSGTFARYDKKGTAYKPKAGLRYSWVSGTKNTEYKRYKKDDMDGGWGAWDRSEEEEMLKEWSTSENLQGSGTYDNEPRKNGSVIEETDNTGATYMDYEHTVIGDTIRTVENEYDYSSGVFGCHKHHVVEWTESTGSTDTYYASVKADNPIKIKFIGQTADEAVISVNNVLGGIELNGSIGNRQLYETADAAGNIARNAKGTLFISAGRIGQESLKQTSGALYGRIISLRSSEHLENINIAAGDDVYLQLFSWYDGTNAQVNVENLAGAKGRLHLNANSGDMTSGGKECKWGVLDVTNNSSSGDIIQAGEKEIVADRLNLKTSNGSIYGADGIGSAMRIRGGQNVAADDSMSASVNAQAKGDINLEQTNGDLRVGKIYSLTGDVTLKAAGSIVDVLPDSDGGQGSEASRLERWRNIGLIEGGRSELMAAKNRLNKEKALGEYKTWDKTALLYAVSESIINPSADRLDGTSKKDPNIIGHNITITAGGGIGQSGATQEIMLTGILDKNADGSYKNANALQDLKTLADADVTNVQVRTDANGNKIAVIKDTQPLGIQQTLKNGAAGRLNAQSTASGSTKGDIFLQGREEIGTEKFSVNGLTTKDLNVDKIITESGIVTLTSLGGIYNNAADTDAVNIRAQSLYLTALDNIGSDVALNVNLYGQDENTDGLSAIAGGSIAISQQGEEALLVRNISAGNDVLLYGDNFGGANVSIESVNGSIKADAIVGTSIVLQAKKGSADIGKLTAESSLRTDVDNLHIGEANIRNAVINLGRKAVFDKFSVSGAMMINHASAYDLGDGMQLTLTGGRQSPWDALLLHGTKLHEFSHKRMYSSLYPSILLEKVMGYDVYERLSEPHIRPGLLFNRYNLLEQEEEI